MVYCRLDMLSIAAKIAAASVDLKATDVTASLAIEAQPGKFLIEASSPVGMFRALIPYEGDGQEPARVYVDPKRITKVLEKMKSDRVGVQISTQKASLVITPEGDSKSKSTLKYELDRRSRTIYIGAKGSQVETNKQALHNALSFCLKYLPPMNEFSRQFDFVCFQSGVAYASNGSSMRGYLVSALVKSLTGINFRKQAVPGLLKALTRMPEGGMTTITHDEALITVCTSIEDHEFHYTTQKSGNNPAAPNLSYLKEMGAHIVLDEKALLGLLDRVSASSYEKASTPIGVEILIGEEGVSVDLVSDTTEAKGTVQYELVGTEELPEQTTKVLDLGMLKTMLKSFSAGSAPHRFYLLDSNVRYYKVAGSYEIEGSPVIELGVAVLPTVVQR